MLRYIVSILLFFSVVAGFCQIDTDTSEVRKPKPPKVKKELEEFIPTGVRLGVDLYSVGRRLWEDGKTSSEFQLDVDFRHYLLVFEYGTSNLEEVSSGFAYTNNGSYFRIGPEINFLYSPTSLNVISVGFRYASSSFDDFLSYKTEDAFGTTQIVANNKNSSANWVEFTTGTRVKLWKGLFMGFTLRYKFLKKVKFDDLEPFIIPGFGENRLDDTDQFGFSYYLMWRFGFKKKAKVKELVED